ncbi:DUF5994 family protein [Streptomyces thermocarboxydus]
MWWPYSRDLLTQLPKMLAALPRAWGDITGVTVDAAAWSAAPGRMFVANQVVRLHKAPPLRTLRTGSSCSPRARPLGSAGDPAGRDGGSSRSPHGRRPGRPAARRRRRSPAPDPDGGGRSPRPCGAHRAGHPGPRW